MKMVPAPPGECLAWRDPELSLWLLGYEVLNDVKMYRIGRTRWTKGTGGREGVMRGCANL